MPVTDGPRRVTRVAAYALCTDGNAILLSRIAQGATACSDGTWTLPGGGVDFGEDPRDATSARSRSSTWRAPAPVSSGSPDNRH